MTFDTLVKREKTKHEYRTNILCKPCADTFSWNLHIDPIQYVLIKKSIEKCKQKICRVFQWNVRVSQFQFWEGQLKIDEVKIGFPKYIWTWICMTTTSIMLALIYILVVVAWQQHQKYPTKTTNNCELIHTAWAYGNARYMLIENISWD